MGVIMIVTDEPGQINQPGIRRVKIISTDNLATVTAAGYLNPDVLQGYFIYNTDIIDMWYGAVGSANFITNPGSYAEFIPSISNGVITLVKTVQPGAVTVTGTPTTGHIARFAGASSIEDGGVLGLAAAKSVSDDKESVLAAVSGSFSVGNIAVFADTAGTIEDGGSLGEAATKSVSDNTKSSVASVDGATVIGNLLQAADITGTIEDSGVSANDVQLSANIIANSTADIGGGGAGPISVVVAGLTVSSKINATIASSSNVVAVAKCVATATGFDITFTADPGAACVVNYVAFVVAQ